MIWVEREQEEFLGEATHAASSTVKFVSFAEFSASNPRLGAGTHRPKIDSEIANCNSKKERGEREREKLKKKQDSDSNSSNDSPLEIATTAARIPKGHTHNIHFLACPKMPQELPWAASAARSLPNSANCLINSGPKLLNCSLPSLFYMCVCVHVWYVWIRQESEVEGWCYPGGYLKIGPLRAKRGLPKVCSGAANNLGGERERERFSELIGTKRGGLAIGSCVQRMIVVPCCNNDSNSSNSLCEIETSRSPWLNYESIPKQGEACLSPKQSRAAEPTNLIARKLGWAKFISWLRDWIGWRPALVVD